MLVARFYWGGMHGWGGMCSKGGHVWSRGACVAGVMHGRGACMVRRGGMCGQEGGVHGRGACVAGGMHGRGACMDMHGWGACMACVWPGNVWPGGHVWPGCVWSWGVCGQGGMRDEDTAGQCMGGTHPTGMHSCIPLAALGCFLGGDFPSPVHPNNAFVDKLVQDLRGLMCDRRCGAYSWFLPGGPVACMAWLLGGHVWQRGAWQGGMHGMVRRGGGHAWQGAWQGGHGRGTCMVGGHAWQGGVCGQVGGVCGQGGMHGQGVCGHGGCVVRGACVMKIQLVNVWAVHILLECILVFHCFYFKKLC